VEQGKRAADEMIEATGGKGDIAILLGSAGNNVTTERTKGFVDRIKDKAPGLKVVFQQTGDFAREKGQSVTENLIQSKPGIKGIYAENDEMGLGAVNALKGAGKKPGAVKIVTIDGTRNAVQGIVDGWIHGVIESNPRFGPLAFQTLDTFTKGSEVAQDIVIKDSAYTEANAQSDLDKAY
jgi:ribose transport system substrate-binding protein